MERKELRILVSLFTTVIILIIYCMRVYNLQLAGNLEMLNDFRFWGKSFLILIPVLIVAQIIIQIIFAVLKAAVTRKETPEITDERDKIIELKAIRISHWTFCAGFFLAMGSLAMGMQPYVFFITLIASCFAAGLAEGVCQIFYYRKGG